MAARLRSCSGSAQLGQAASAYATRQERAPGKLEHFVAKAAAPVHARDRSWRFLSRILGELHQHTDAFSALSDAELRSVSTELRYRLKASNIARPVAAETFALIREISGRCLGMQHFDEQLVGGWAMLNGVVVEMETGEGKTLTATLPAVTAALAGIPVHVITVNDYLAGRDAQTMRPIFAAVGLTVGAALADMSDDERKAAYACDVTYTTNKQVAFDHLRDRIQLRGQHSQLGLHFLNDLRSGLLLRGLHFAIIDEADSVLVDEAVTPLIISRQGQPIYAEEMLLEALNLAKSLQLVRHYHVQASERRLTLSAAGQEELHHRSEGLSGLWRNARYREHLVTQGLRALHLYQRDRHYLVDDGKVKIIDEFTGRLMADRSWEQGLHQLIEVKEGCDITGEMETIGRISYQRFFRRYLMLGGMSGTVREVAGELRDVYGLEVVSIPTHRESQRQAFRSRVLPSGDDKWALVVERIQALHAQGRPVLVGTRSVAASEDLSERLRQLSLPHSMLNARQDEFEADVIAAAGEWGQITVATNMAGRGTDIKLAPEVVDLGGLHVLATERHEARRIDRQLIGRCARQGDPGSYEEFASLEDDLVASYLPPHLQRVAASLLASGLTAGESLALALVRRAQKNAQSKSAKMRVQMQKMDEYLANVLAFTGRLE